MQTVEHKLKKSQQKNQIELKQANKPGFFVFVKSINFLLSRRNRSTHQEILKGVFNLHGDYGLYSPVHENEHVYSNWLSGA